MKDWTATITLSYQIRAADEDQAQERADALADRLMWVKPDINPRLLGTAPSWVGDQTDSTVEVEEA